MSELILIDKCYLEHLQKIGLLKFNAIRNLDMYDYYCRQKKIVGSMQAITNTAAKYFLSENAVQKVVGKMRKICRE
jgi:hypothetical protein